MNEYRFDLGNSTTGPVGSVIYVRADTAEQAHANLVGYLSGIEVVKLKDDDSGIEILCYLNPASITVNDLELAN
jgi:hypothetical protein